MTDLVTQQKPLPEPLQPEHDHSNQLNLVRNVGVTAAIHAGMFAANVSSLVPLYALTGAIKAVEFLTKDQHSFLCSLTNHCDLAKRSGNFSSFSELVRDTDLAKFSDVFSLNTPLAGELKRMARDKVNEFSTNGLA